MKKNPTLSNKIANMLYEWRKETHCLSSTTEMIANKWYQYLIEEGEDAIPYLVEEEDGHLHHALKAITGEDPTNEDDAGDIDAHARSWRDWLIAKELRKRYPETHVVFGLNLEPFEYAKRHEPSIVWMGDNGKLDIRITHSSYFGKRRHEYLEVVIFVSLPDDIETEFHFISDTWEGVEEALTNSFDEDERTCLAKIEEENYKLSEIQNKRKWFQESLK